MIHQLPSLTRFPSNYVRGVFRRPIACIRSLLGRVTVELLQPFFTMTADRRSHARSDGVPASIHANMSEAELVVAGGAWRLMAEVQGKRSLLSTAAVRSKSH